jgi:hypothetical protein
VGFTGPRSCLVGASPSSLVRPASRHFQSSTQIQPDQHPAHRGHLLPPCMPMAAARPRPPPWHPPPMLPRPSPLTAFSRAARTSRPNWSPSSSTRGCARAATKASARGSWRRHWTLPWGCSASSTWVAAGSGRAGSFGVKGLQGYGFWGRLDIWGLGPQGPSGSSGGRLLGAQGFWGFGNLGSRLVGFRLSGVSGTAGLVRQRRVLSSRAGVRGG